MGGRKAKPTALKLLDGNPGNRPINKHEPAPAKVYSPDPPPGFDEVQTAKWNQMAGKLARIRVLTELDLDALEMYCREWVLMHEALTHIAEHGRMIDSANGGKIWSPMWAQYKHSQKVVRQIQSEFGMTPSTRTSLVADADDTGQNRWVDF